MSHRLTAARLTGLAAAGVALVAAEGAALAQDAADGRIALEPITVTATRSTQGRPVSSIPGSVSIVTREDIEQQRTVVRSVADVLTNLVPGFSPSTQSASNFGQQLRGREFLVLIDGVPQSTPLRRISRDLNTIDLSAVERVEVIRGSAATFGYGATGGVINIITKSGGGAPTFRTEIGGDLSLSHPGDSLGGSFLQSVQGSAGKVDYLVSGSIREIGGYFDAEGDRIPPDPFQQNGLADSRVVDVLGKVGVQLNDNHRTQLMVNYYDQSQDTDFSTEPFRNPNAPPQRKTQTVAGGPPGENPGNRNLTVNLDHSIADVLGSAVSLQAFFRDYESVNAYYAYGPYQSKLTNQQYGARAAVETPFTVPALGEATVTWGLDVLRDETAQPLIYNGLPLPPQVEYVPEVRQTSWAPFAQLEVPVGDDLLLRGGVRYETVSLDIDTFTNTRSGRGGLVPNVTVQGGTLEYSQALFNVGGVYFLNDETELFAGFSQGFSVADIGRLLRATSMPSVDILNPEAQVVDNYEVGVRAGWNDISGSLTLFYNTSDLGTSFGAPPDFQIQRQKEEVYGLEASLEYRPSDLWAVGGTFGWYEGETDSNGDGEIDQYLDGTRISPAKVTLFGEYNPWPEWRNRVQVLHVADRDRFNGSLRYGQGAVDSYTTVDLISSYDTGVGVVTLGIENLFNEQYITPIGQSANLSYANAAARGTTATLRYSVTY